MGMAYGRIWWYASWSRDPRSTKQKREDTADHRAELNDHRDKKEDRNRHDAKGRRLVMPAAKMARAREQRTRKLR